MIDDRVRFREVQRFCRSPFALIGPVGGLAGCASALWAGASTGTFAITTLVVAVVMGSVGFLLLFGALRTEVRDDGLYARLFPLTRLHRFEWHEIRSCQARSYRPIREYGGWGVRWSRHGKAYNVYGKRGVQLEFTSGSRLLIGSQRADELASLINQLRTTR